MYRLILAGVLAVGAACLVQAADPPEIGKKTDIVTVKTRETIVKGPGFGGPPAAMTHEYRFTLPMEQGEKFKFEVKPLNGVAMSVRVEVSTEDGKPFLASPYGPTVNWAMNQGAPGESLKVVVRASAAAKAHLTVESLDNPVKKDSPPSKLKDLEAENAALKKRIAELEKKLNDIEKKGTTETVKPIEKK